METIHVFGDRAVPLAEVPSAPCSDGFYWLDIVHEEFLGDPERLRDVVQQLAGIRLFDLHLQDAGNLQHPSFFDTTTDYDMLIFRKLATAEAPPLTPRAGRGGRPGGRHLQEIVTRPITFFVFDRLLVTVRNRQSKTIEQVRARLLDFRARAQTLGTSVASNGELPLTRLPVRPDELMLRLLNGMVDRYLDLRQPLTDSLDRWQRELLDPRQPFFDWGELLDARIEIRKLENLSEEQLDALQELRDSYLEATPEAQQSDGFLVRINDVMEHINRVLNHARRLENSVETAVQLHFSATAHRTNRIVRTLTVITAVFAPLTLITGIWGMNLSPMPLQGNPHGFAWVVGGMLTLASVLLLFFWLRRLFTDGPPRD